MINIDTHLTHCIAVKITPKGLNFELESTIGNFDQEIIDKWYFKLQGFSLVLMKDDRIFKLKHPIN